MKLSAILWEDACQIGGTSWSAPIHERYPVLSIGVIAKETKNTIHLARDYDADPPNAHRALLAIPKILILERRDYNIAKSFIPTGVRETE